MKKQSNKSKEEISYKMAEKTLESPLLRNDLLEGKKLTKKEQVEMEHEINEDFDMGETQDDRDYYGLDD